QESRQQRQQEEHDRALGKNHSEGEAEHGRQEDEHSQTEQRAEVVDQKGSGQRHRKMQELLERQHLGALQFSDQAGGPREQEGEHQAVPHEKQDDPRGTGQGKPSREEQAEEKKNTQEHEENCQDCQNYRVGGPALLELILEESPP